MPIALRLDRKWSDADLDDIVRLQQEKARTDFWSYRQIVHPTMYKGWFQRQVAAELQAFCVDLKAGKRPMMLLQSPPQHGKSEQVVDLGFMARQ